jgi:hypothetical protein
VFKRILKGSGALAALGALALGGSAFASAQSSTTAKQPAVKVHRTVEKTNASDMDNIQSGDQTTPDTGANAKASSTETSTENAPENSAASDGPGGHADPPGANVDHQATGQE